MVEPLLEAGRLTFDLVKEAKTQSARPGDPAADRAKRALQFFDMWHNAMNNAGKVEDPRVLTFLEEVQRATEGSEGDLWDVWKMAKDLDEALPAAAVK